MKISWSFIGIFFPCKINPAGLLHMFSLGTVSSGDIWWIRISPLVFEFNFVTLYSKFFYADEALIWLPQPPLVLIRAADSSHCGWGLEIPIHRCQFPHGAEQKPVVHSLSYQLVLNSGLQTCAAPQDFSSTLPAVKPSLKELKSHDRVAPVLFSFLSVIDATSARTEASTAKGTKCCKRS